MGVGAAGRGQERTLRHEKLRSSLLLGPGYAGLKTCVPAPRRTAYQGSGSLLPFAVFVTEPFEYS